MKNKTNLGEILSHSDKNEWLKILYGKHHERFLADNKRIWSTASIFIPLSLSTFAFLLNIEEITSIKVTILGCVSIAIYLFWMVVAEGHKMFQENSDQIMIEIEHELGFEFKSRKKPTGFIKNMRWISLASLTIGWLVVHFLVTNSML